MVGKKIHLQIHRKTSISDGGGGQTVTWYGVKTLKGILNSLKARENFTNDVTKAISTHYFQCNFPNDIVITEKDRCLCTETGELFEIIFVDNLAMKNITLSLQLNKIK